MKVIPYGAKVKTVIGGVEAIITGVSLRGNSIRYNIAYFSNGVQQDIWVESVEVEMFNDEKKKAGLVNYDPPINDEIGKIDLTLPDK